MLAANRFTTLGAAQFLRDVHAILDVVDRYIPDASGAMAFLADAARLLSLPVAVEGGSDPFSEGEGEQKGVEGGGVEEDKRDGDEDSGALTLKRASDRIFVDNNEARRVLEELGLDMLEPQHARRVVQNRVENSD